ncbi:uncharacterized protein B0P05DRAFT_535595 [Gilbertella persicaria]|uniref:uncharacterized protein n=1 Tax=Gilbertella persicaria TaxID=101096 RepID=UPI002220E4E0|nr:uncharacterized protein B0P05DRAFT_535595 [Gilbertella persicaria]KAI8083956.1 hypothetical protein B0P05DRAFT_535595 [Gilbertella persicaria]
MNFGCFVLEAVFFSPIDILQTLRMTMHCLYKDGQGHIVGELMDLDIDEELFAIKTISSRTQFLLNKPPENLHLPPFFILQCIWLQMKGAMI